MTKEEIADWLETAYFLYDKNKAAQVRKACEAIRALDVCTPVEREWLEASFKSYAASDLASAERRLRAHDALERERAERTPPDPVEVFIAEVRRKVTDDTKPMQSVVDIAASLAKLDAARGRTKP